MHSGWDAGFKTGNFESTAHTQFKITKKYCRFGFDCLQTPDSSRAEIASSHVDRCVEMRTEKSEPWTACTLLHGKIKMSKATEANDVLIGRM